MVFKQLTIEGIFVMAEEEKIDKSDESILFPDVKIGEINVKPWSFGMLFEISPYLEQVIDKAEASGLVKKLEESGGFLSYTIMARVFTIASPHILEILSITTGKDKEYIKALDMESGMKLAVTVYNQNKGTITNSLKNVFSPPVKKERSGGRK